jgi:hypothetical protein
MKVALSIAAVLVGGFLILAVLGTRPQPTGDINHRIEAECRKTYQTEDAVNRCILVVSAQYLKDQQAKQLQGVYDRVR